MLTEKRVEFDHVVFQYVPNNPVLKSVSFAAAGGKTVALVGATGSGKSTCLRLLYRFYDVTSGAISIDGQDIRSVRLSTLRQCIGMVPQDVVLFNNTCKYNIRYGKASAGDADVFDAARAAAVHDTIVQKFPQVRLCVLPVQSKIYVYYCYVLLFTGLRDSGRGARPASERRGEAAHGHRARHPERRAHHAAGRGDVCAGQPYRKGHSDRGGHAEEQPNDDHCGAPAVNGHGRRPDCGVQGRCKLTVSMGGLQNPVQDGVVAEQGSHQQLMASGGIYSTMWSRQKQDADVVPEEEVEAGASSSSL